MNRQIGMIIGPCFGYLIQCYTIQKERNADGFSPFICLILLIANILRVFWWYVLYLTLDTRFAERFSVVLLLASMLMIIC
jgi:hypothetical protein